MMSEIHEPGALVVAGVGGNELVLQEQRRDWRGRIPRRLRSTRPDRSADRARRLACPPRSGRSPSRTLFGWATALRRVPAFKAISHQVVSMNCVNPAAPELALNDLGSQTPASAPPLILPASASISAASGGRADLGDRLGVEQRRAIAFVDAEREVIARRRPAERAGRRRRGRGLRPADGDASRPPW